MKWQGALYIDCVLPFGLRSAPKIFNTVADALQWVLLNQGIEFIFYYLDNFLCIIPPTEPGRLDYCNPLEVITSICSKLEIPLVSDKVMGPSTCLVFLGIEIDTIRMQIRLPEEKLLKVRKEVTRWLSRRKACRKRELQSLVGLIQHACKVVRPEHIFVQRLIETMEVAKHADHWVRLNASFRSDLLWWDTFLVEWNGVSMLWSRNLYRKVTLTSDASGTWGCGAFANSQWFQVEWSNDFKAFPIHVKELIPIVIGAIIWGHDWSGEIVRFICDNQAVVEVVNRGYSRDSTLMQLMCSLFFVAAKFNFWFEAAHIPGVENNIADAISRNILSTAFVLKPELSRVPSFISQDVLSLLISEHSWTSPHWAQRFNSCLINQ